MKKISFEVIDVLQRNEMKSILGGYMDEDGSGPATCTADCPHGKKVSCYGYGCLATDNVGCSYTTSPNGTAKAKNC